MNDLIFLFLFSNPLFFLFFEMQNLLKTVRIQTGVVRRLRGDYLSYVEELGEDNSRVESLSKEMGPEEAEDSELSCRLRQARNVVAETKSALADTGVHLDRAVKGLEEAVEKLKKEAGDTEEGEVKELVEKAVDIIGKAKETLAKKVEM